MDDATNPYVMDWLGVSGDCANMTMNNQSVVAGTKLAIGVNQRTLAMGQRPRSIFVLERPEGLLRRVLVGMGHDRRLVTKLPLKSCRAGGDHLLMTDPWPVPAPDPTKGRRRLVCSLDPGRFGRGPSVISLGSRTISRQVVGKPRQVELVGGFDIVGHKAELNVQSKREWTDTFEVIAALDPRINLSVLGGGHPGLREYLTDYLDETAERYDIPASGLTSQFFQEYAYEIEGESIRSFPISLDRDFVDLEPTANAIARATVTMSGSFGTYGSTLIAIKAQDVDTRQQVVSDLILIAGGNSRSRFRGSRPGYTEDR